METLNSKIKIVAVELIAKSRMLLINEDKPENCLTIVLDNDTINVQDKIYPVDQITSFNAFTQLVDKGVQENTMSLILRKLRDEDVEKINKLLS